MDKIAKHVEIWQIKTFHTKKKFLILNEEKHHNLSRQHKLKHEDYTCWT